MPGRVASDWTSFMTTLTKLRVSTGEGVTAAAADAAAEWASRFPRGINPSEVYKPTNDPAAESLPLPFTYDILDAAFGKLTVAVVPPVGTPAGMEVGIYVRWRHHSDINGIPMLLFKQTFTDPASIYGGALLNVEGPPGDVEFTVVTSVAGAMVFYSQTI